jgi:hypothetical protein
VAELAAIQPPTRAQLQKANATRWLDETREFTVKALLIGFKLEADSDFHVVIADPANPKATMIVEIPAPQCLKGAPSVPGKGSLGDQLQAQRDKLEAAYGKATPRFKRLAKPVPVTVTGVGFFDFLHGQTGVAPNGFELHPVLEITSP